MNVIDTLLLEPLKVFYENVMRFLPDMLTAFLIFILGIVLGVIFKAIFFRLFRILKIDDMMGHSGVAELLSKSGIKDSVSAMISKLIGWFVFLIFCFMAINTLQIEAIGKLFESFLIYLPQFFVALLILLVGYLLSNFFYRTALIAAVNAGNKFAGMIARFVKYAVLILAVTMALEQLGVGKGTVVIAFAIIFGGVVLAFAVAFGLGGRDIARRYLEKYVDKDACNETDDKINHL